jgi:23S rRNA (cytidine1920-2'-O)/16S rRNA (cytidine1409-2'-O)-methyltransferase
VSNDEHPYVSRGGLKLAAALDAFALDPTGMNCADLGCSVGGFTDCLLQRGAAHVFAVDTAYGDFAWKLRQDARVTLLERTNALHFDPMAEFDGFTGCDLVTLDLGWTRQAKALPAAVRWLKQSEAARIITLIKPHYEAPRDTPTTKAPRGGTRKNKRKAHRAKAEPMPEAEAEQVLANTLAALKARDVQPLDWCRSPITGSKGGNIEYLALLRRA